MTSAAWQALATLASQQMRKDNSSRRHGAIVDRKQIGGSAQLRGDPSRLARGLGAGAGQPSAVASPSQWTLRQRGASAVPDTGYLIDAVVFAKASHRVR